VPALRGHEHDATTIDHQGLVRRQHHGDLGERFAVVLEVEKTKVLTEAGEFALSQRSAISAMAAVESVDSLANACQSIIAARTFEGAKL